MLFDFLITIPRRSVIPRALQLVLIISLVSISLPSSADEMDDIDFSGVDCSLGANHTREKSDESTEIIDIEEPEVINSKESDEVSTDLPILTLSDALQMALSDNNTLELARQAVDISRAAGRSAMAEFLPDIYSTYAWTHALDANTIEIPDIGEFELTPQDTFYMGLTFTYSLYNGGQDTATERAGEAETEAARLRVKQAEALIRVAVTSAYTGVLEAQARLVAAGKSLEHLDKVLHSAQAHYDAGYLPMSDLLAVKVARSQTALGVADLERAHELAQSALAILTGSDIRDRWALVPVAFPESDVPFSMDTLWDWALESRPELNELDSQRVAICAQIDAIKSARNPRVNFQADVTRSGSDPLGGGGSEFSGGTNIQGMISIWWDLYDFGRNDELITPLEEQLTLLDIQQAELEIRIQQEVESALLNIQTQLGNIQLSREATAQAEEAFRVAQRRREEGLGLMLEVLDAEATLAQIEAGYTHTLYEYYRGITTLAQTVGMTTDDLIALIDASANNSSADNSSADNFQLLDNSVDSFQQSPLENITSQEDQ